MSLLMASCSRFGGIEQSMTGEEAGHYLKGLHSCALKTFSPAEVVADPAGFF